MNKLAKISILLLLLTAALTLSGCIENKKFVSTGIRFQSTQPDIVKAMTFNIRTNTVIDILNSWS
ncbi:MAG: hypothetical protein FVQ79_12475, partial [Planctomycetes bacterium]|nr:hypothetical protein [Planctomycetota bacterium]